MKKNEKTMACVFAIIVEAVFAALLISLGLHFEAVSNDSAANLVFGIWFGFCPLPWFVAYFYAQHWFASRKKQQQALKIGALVLLDAQTPMCFQLHQEALSGAFSRQESN